MVSKYVDWFNCYSSGVRISYLVTGIIFYKPAACRNVERQSVVKILIDVTYLKSLRQGVDHQKFRWLRKLLNQFPVFHLKVTFEASQIAWFWNFIVLKLYGFNQIITDIHHQFHSSKYLLQNKLVF